MRKAGRRGWRDGVALVLTLAAAAPPAWGEFTKRYDRFTASTVVELRPLLGGLPRGDFRPRLFVIASWKRDSKEPVRTMALGLGGAWPVWRYLDCHSLYWLADGVPVDLGSVAHDGDVLADGSVIEHVWATEAPFDGVKKLAYARKVEFRICEDEYVVSEAELMDLRGIVAEAIEHNRLLK